MIYRAFGFMQKIMLNHKFNNVRNFNGFVDCAVDVC